MRFISKVAVSCLLLLNIGLIFTSFGHSNWAVFDESEKLSLFACADCEGLKPDWSFECLARSICPMDGQNSKCSLYTDLYKSSYSYLILEFASLLMASLFLEKIIFLCINRYPGPKITIYFSGIFMLIFHTSATILWFIYSEAGLSCPSTDFKDRPEICIGYGPAIALANIPLMLITVLFLACSLSKSDLPYQKEIIPGDFLKISGSFWIWVCLIISGLYSALILASLTIKKWVVSDDFEGSLIRCKDCTEVEWLSWNCLKSQYCDINQDSKQCKDYKELANASDYFIILQAVCFILIAHYIQYLTAIVKGTLYGTVFTNYSTSVLLIGVNLASTIGWFVRSDVRADCDSDKTCMSIGPQLSIASNIILLPIALIFCIVLYKRLLVEIVQSVGLKHYNSLALSRLGSLNLDETVLAKPVDETSLVKSN